MKNVKEKKANRTKWRGDRRKSRTENWYYISCKHSDWPQLLLNIWNIQFIYAIVSIFLNKHIWVFSIKRIGNWIIINTNLEIHLYICNILGLNFIFSKFQFWMKKREIQGERKKCQTKLILLCVYFHFLNGFYVSTCNHVLPRHCNTILVQCVEMWCGPKLLRGTIRGENLCELECEIVFGR